MSNAGYGIPGQLNNEGVKIVENEEAINTETELFGSAKRIIDQSSEGEFRANGVYDPISESIDSETHKKHLCEAFYGERTGPVKCNDILDSASKGDFYHNVNALGFFFVRNVSLTLFLKIVFKKLMWKSDFENYF